MTVNGAVVERAAVPATLSAAGVAALVLGNGYGALGEDGRVGAGFMPMLAGGLLVLLGILDLALMRRTPRQGEDEPPSDLEDLDDLDVRGRSGRQRRRLLVAVFVLLYLTIIAVQVIGFLLAFGLLILVCSVVLERHRLLPSVLVACLAVAATYCVFARFLHVPLPTGYLGLI